MFELPGAPASGRRGVPTSRIYADPVLELTALYLDEIATALADQNDYEHRLLINTTTGELVGWTRDAGIDGHHPIDLDDLDPDLLGIDPLPSRVWCQDMADFADEISDESAGRRLGSAIAGRGAFRRFKDELRQEHPKLLPIWYAFRTTAPDSAPSSGCSTTGSSIRTPPTA